MPVLIIGFSRRGSLSRMLANAGMGVQQGREVDREKRLVSEFDDPEAFGNRGGDYRGVVLLSSQDLDQFDQYQLPRASSEVLSSSIFLYDIPCLFVTRG